VPVTGADVVLDVAGGSGRLGRYLAERAAFAVIVDLTPEMLATGAASAAEDGARNVLFTEGDATRLPFPEAQFDVVVNRFAFHHLDDPGLAAREMARVCRPGGLVAVIDVAAGDGAVAARRDELERLRDPSHTRALAPDELIGLMREAGVAAELASERRRTLDAVPWIEQGQPAEDAATKVLAALEGEADGGPETGFEAARTEDGLVIRHLYVIAAGRNGSPD
jgi:SAM-dependent methyltransferase